MAEKSPGGGRSYLEVIASNYSNIRVLPKGSAFEYNFLMSLNEKDYPKYLKQAYLIKTGQKLNLKHPKTLNEKIQWLKLYDNLPIKTRLTDKVLVRDWVKERIGEEYLKPVLQICDSFDEIDFDSLPDKFVIKCNHGCKWYFFVKNKAAFLENKQLFNSTKEIFNNWLVQTFFGWSDFELQYKNIVPKILIEPLLWKLGDNGKIIKHFEQIQIYCFNSNPPIIVRSCRKNEQKMSCVYDSKFNPVNLKFDSEIGDIVVFEPDNNLKKSFELSKILAVDFKFVRIDWMIYKDKLYFEEMTFTPYSGFIPFPQEYSEWNIKLGNILNLKGNKNEK